MTHKKNNLPQRWYEHFNWWYVGGILLLVGLKVGAYIINHC